MKMQLFLPLVILSCTAVCLVTSQFPCRTPRIPRIRERSIVYRPYNDSIEDSINKTLENNHGVKADLEAKIEERKFSPIISPWWKRYRTCNIIKYVYRTMHYDWQAREWCYIISGQQVRDVVCSYKPCYGCTHAYRSMCMPDGKQRIYFWVWCRKCGFKLVFRDIYTCCNCFRWWRRSCKG